MLLKHKKKLLYACTLVFGLILTVFSVHKDQTKHELAIGLSMPVANADTPGGSGGDNGNGDDNNDSNDNNTGDNTGNTNPPRVVREAPLGHSGDDGDDSSRWNEDN